MLNGRRAFHNVFVCTLRTSTSLSSLWLEFEFRGILLPAQCSAVTKTLWGIKSLADPCWLSDQLKPLILLLLPLWLHSVYTAVSHVKLWLWLLPQMTKAFFFSGFRVWLTLGLMHSRSEKLYAVQMWFLSTTWTKCTSFFNSKDPNPSVIRLLLSMCSYLIYCYSFIKALFSYTDWAHQRTLVNLTVPHAAHVIRCSE